MIIPVKIVVNRAVVAEVHSQSTDILLPDGKYLSIYDRSGYNTTDCLVDLIDEITKALDEEKYAVSIFLDLSKAFDTVNHSILLSKLDLYGIRGNENQWFRSYLRNRKQKVFVNGGGTKRQPQKNK